MRTLASSAAIVCLLCLLPAPAHAVDAQLQWVEVEAALAPDGKAMVRYHVRWNVRGGDMGGFYFQGEQGRIRWHRLGCGAVTTDGREYKLDLIDLGDRWDVLLASGQRYGPGTITYVLTYFTDYAAAGHLAPTTSPEHGDLVVLPGRPGRVLQVPFPTLAVG